MAEIGEGSVIGNYRVIRLLGPSGLCMGIRRAPVFRIVGMLHITRQ